MVNKKVLVLIGTAVVVSATCAVAVCKIVKRG